MPFQSEKQRRYLHANHPEIAKRWERDYANGGILDINASEEIISDDGNNIELTAYNAEFDDPKDLSTGVKTLFQAKDGGRIGFFTGMREAEQKAQERASRGPRDDPDRFGPTTETKTIHKDPILDMVDKKKIPGTEEYMEEEKKDYVFMPEKKLVDNKFAKTRPAKYVTLKEKAYWDRLDKVAEDIRDSWSYKTEKKIGEELINKIIGSFGIPFLGQLLSLLGLKPKVIPKRNLAGDILEDEVTGADLGFFDPDEYPELWGKGPDEDDKDPELPKVVPIGEEIEAYAQTPPGISSRDWIKANQAKRAMLVEQGIIQENPIVDESVTDITMEANSGGLANLFRVKNQ